MTSIPTAEPSRAPVAPPATAAPVFDPDMAVNFWRSPQARDASCLPCFTWCADGTHRERDGGIPSGWWDRYRMKPLADGDTSAADTEEEACM